MSAFVIDDFGLTHYLMIRQKRYRILPLFNGKNNPVRNLFRKPYAKIPGSIFITVKIYFSLAALCFYKLIFISAITLCAFVKIIDRLIINFCPITAVILFVCPVVAPSTNFLQLTLWLTPRNFGQNFFFTINGTNVIRRYFCLLTLCNFDFFPCYTSFYFISIIYGK